MLISIGIASSQLEFEHGKFAEYNYDSYIAIALFRDVHNRYYTALYTKLGFTYYYIHKNIASPSSVYIDEMMKLTNGELQFPILASLLKDRYAL